MKKQHETGLNPEGQNEDSAPDAPSTRREYLKSAGKLGVGASLAHFLLIGGAQNRAFADEDACYNLVGDVCQPSDDNPDLCGTDAITDDECVNGSGTGGDSDWCNSPFTAASGDVCCSADDQLGGDICDYE